MPSLTFHLLKGDERHNRVQFKGAVQHRVDGRIQLQDSLLQHADASLDGGAAMDVTVDVQRRCQLPGRATNLQLLALQRQVQLADDAATSLQLFNQPDRKPIKDEEEWNGSKSVIDGSG